VPELPDVEVYRRTLARTSLHRRIDRVRVRDDSMLRGVTGRRLSAALRGHELEATHRHGKHLLVDVSDGGELALHFGMTGHLETGDEVDGPHVRLELRFADGGALALVDQRRLGHVALAAGVDELVAQQDLGPDALSLGPREFADILRRSRGGLKATLMDQSVIAGLGNIYTDEVLFQARLDPRARAADLSPAEQRRLHRQLQRVLALAIGRDADPDRLPATWLLPHREDGAPCPRGRGVVRRLRVNGRAGYWCPECQAG
jgi:formamidopyrimidine-DNA glycosylase